MTFFIIMYSITLSNLAWLILAWEDDRGYSRLSRIKRALELRKLDKEYAEHFGPCDPKWTFSKNRR